MKTPRFALVAFLCIAAAFGLLFLLDGPARGQPAAAGGVVGPPGPVAAPTPAPALAPALAPAEPTVTATVTMDPNTFNPGDNLGGIAGFLVSAFQGGKWFAVGSIILLLATWLIGRLLKMDSDWLAIVNLATGMLASACVEFFKPEYVWYQVLIGAFVTSGPAALFWTTMLKKILPKTPATDPVPK